MTIIYPQKCQILPQNSNFKPKWWNMKVQVYQKLLNWTWKFDTLLRTWNSVLRCNMMTSQQIQYGGRPPYWKSYFGYISAIYCSINVKFGCYDSAFYFFAVKSAREDLAGLCQEMIQNVLTFHDKDAQHMNKRRRKINPLTGISRSRYISILNISQTTRDRAIVTIERQ